MPSSRMESLISSLSKILRERSNPKLAGIRPVVLILFGRGKRADQKVVDAACRQDIETVDEGML